jgi:hypothetical protein
VRDDSSFYALDPATPREIAHIHSGRDFSGHVVLAPKDALTVIEAGWGQLHGFAGVHAPLSKKEVLPAQYVLLYSPRTEDEVQVLIDIFKAGIGFMTDSREVKGP